MSEYPPKGPPKRNVVRLGRLCVEPDVPPVLAQAGVTLSELLARHQAGDWGMVDDEWEEEHLNEAAKRGGTVTSVYYLDPGEFIWITTEVGVTYVILAFNIHRA